MGEALQLLSIVFCMFGQAFFAGIETGITAINRLRLRHFVRQDEHAAIILQGFLDDSDRFLGTTLMGTNICLVVISVFSASLATKWIGSRAEPLSAVIVSAFVLLFGEYIPKAWFSSKPYYRSSRFAGVLLMAEKVLKPLSVLMVGLTRALVPGGKKSFATPLPFISREDIKSLTKDGEKSGVFSRRETWMIHRVFDLSDKKASEIMVPRDEIRTISKEATVEEFLQKARKHGVTRMPVYDPATKDIVGIVNLLYVLSALPGAAGKSVGDLARPPQFIAETMPVDDIFPRLRRSRQPMCLVRNGSDEVVGLVTTEDILEEIVGKL